MNNSTLNARCKAVQKTYNIAATFKSLIVLFLLAPIFLSAKNTASPADKQASQKKFYSPLGITETIRANLYLLYDDGSTILADGDYAVYNDLYHDSVTNEDAMKFTNILENIALVRYGKLLTVERRPLIKDKNDTLFFKLWKTTQRKYQLEFVANMLTNDGLQGYFVDSYLGTSTPLALGGTTKINVAINGDAGSKATDRFKIVFKPKPAAPPPPVSFTMVNAYQQPGEIAVNWKVENEAAIVKYEVEKSLNGVDFSLVNTTPVNNSTKGNYRWVDNSYASGENTYRINGINADGTNKYTKAVKVIAPKAAMAFTVYPNPVTGNIIKVQFVNQPVGVYQVQLMNLTGQVMYIGRIRISSNNSIEPINVVGLQKGLYQLEIRNADNSMQRKKIIVQ